MRKKGKFVQKSHMDVLSQNWPLLLSAYIFGRNEFEMIDLKKKTYLYFWIVELFI